MAYGSLNRHGEPLPLNIPFCPAKLPELLAVHQGKDKGETVRYYEISSENQKKHGLDAYLDAQYIDDEIYKQKFFMSPFKAALEQLRYSPKRCLIIDFLSTYY
jgi:hypothetical protein